MKSFRCLIPALLLCGTAQDARGDGFLDLWLTRDQQAQRAYDRGDFQQAAKLFTEPMLRGNALYQAKDFEAAAAAFGRTTTAEGAYNRGICLILLGQYREAEAALTAALELRPEWEDAEVNRTIARLRAEMREKSAEQKGEATEVGADDIKFSNEKSPGEEEESTSEEGPPLSDQAVQAMWLRRVQTSPADFLRSKFSYQHARQQARQPEPGKEGAP